MPSASSGTKNTALAVQKTINVASSHAVRPDEPRPTGAIQMSA